jgi:hypothetical protein
MVACPSPSLDPDSCDKANWSNTEVTTTCTDSEATFEGSADPTQHRLLPDLRTRSRWSTPLKSVFEIRRNET